MRRVLLGSVVSILSSAAVCAAAMTPINAAVVHSPGRIARYAQMQSGVASGNVYWAVSAVQPNLSESDVGSYASTGQLGRGRYRFDVAFNDTSTACAHTTDSMRSTGTAKLVRSDGAVLTGTVTVTENCGGVGAVPVSFVVDLTKGSRELVGAHLQFRGAHSMVHVSGPESSSGAEAFALAGTSSATTRIGYWMVGSNGNVYAFGGANPMGNAPTLSAVHIEPTPSGNGYWIVDTLGQVFAFGDARWLGNANRGLLDPGEVITSLGATPTGHGYWLFTDRGRELPFGDTKDFGDLHRLTLNGPVIGSVVTPTGLGYYMVANDGGVFAFGDAKFRGSMGAAHLNQPVIGLVPTFDNRGYWLVASDGGVFTFGDAKFLGSMGSIPLARAMIGLVRYGTGYMMVAQDGGIFDFSRNPFFGSLGGSPPASPIVSAASLG